MERVKQLVGEQMHSAKSFPIRPVHALILDFKMPIKNGLQVVKELKDFYNNTILEYDQVLTRDLFL